MRDGGGGEGDIWFIWKGPRVNRSCGTAKFPSGQLVDVCSTLPRGALEVDGGAREPKRLMLAWHNSPQWKGCWYMHTKNDEYVMAKGTVLLKANLQFFHFYV